MPSINNLLLKVLKTYYLSKSGYFTWEIHPFVHLPLILSVNKWSISNKAIKQDHDYEPTTVCLLHLYCESVSEGVRFDQNAPTGSWKTRQGYRLIFNHYPFHRKLSFVFNYCCKFSPTAASLISSLSSVWYISNGETLVYALRGGFRCNMSWWN